MSQTFKRRCTVVVLTLLLIATFFIVSNAISNTSKSVDILIANDETTYDIELTFCDVVETPLSAEENLSDVSLETDILNIEEPPETLIETTSTVEDSYSYDCYLLAKIIDAEAGSSWISDEHQLLVGSVVLNRVDSDLFPNSIYDVIYDGVYDGGCKQYAPAGTNWFENLIPSDRALQNAKYLIDNGSIAPSNVVWQSEFVQGEVYKTFSYDYCKNVTYFCTIADYQ